MNLFGIIKIVGEFNGGGIHPFHRIEVSKLAFCGFTTFPKVLRLTRKWDFDGYLVTACELFFVVATLYYILACITL